MEKSETEFFKFGVFYFISRASKLNYMEPKTIDLKNNNN